ncbi:MAG TPA: hypothetical protein VGN91_00560 [Bosea sp. (in: a-proteobacteria)]|nr:hypothetical protein [Bosea sp. (in: a-proteobacteria)]
MTLDRARLQVGGDGTEFDAVLTDLIAAARDHAEKYCSVRFAQRTVDLVCDDFAELSRLPEAPASALTSIDYVDVDGAAQSVASTVYETRFDGYEVSIVLKPGQRWPERARGTRVTLKGLVVGGSAPESVRQAMLLMIGAWFKDRENVSAAIRTAVDNLLCNDRRGAF